MSKLPLNLPNRITLLRIVLIPLYLLLLSIPSALSNWAAAIVFAIAALSDWLDGYLARKNGQVTNFGKFMDPIADKLLVLLPMILFACDNGRLSMWAVMIMVAREVIVSGFRLVAATSGTVIAAGMSGKIKTNLQVFTVLLLTLGLDQPGYWLGWASAAVSLYSCVQIITGHREVLEDIS